MAVAGGPVQDLRVAIDRVGRPIVMWSERRGDDFLSGPAMRPSPVVPWSLRPARLATPGPSPPSLAVSRAAALVAWIDGAAHPRGPHVGGRVRAAGRGLLGGPRRAGRRR